MPSYSFTDASVAVGITSVQILPATIPADVHDQLGASRYGSIFIQNSSSGTTAVAINLGTGPAVLYAPGNWLLTPGQSLSFPSDPPQSQINAIAAAAGAALTVWYTKAQGPA